MPTETLVSRAPFLLGLASSERMMMRCFRSRMNRFVNACSTKSCHVSAGRKVDRVPSQKDSHYFCFRRVVTKKRRMKASTAVSVNVSFLEKYRHVGRLVFCASGICFCYWFYGFLQEKILAQSSLGATFILVLQTIANVFVALLWQRVEAPSSSVDVASKPGQKLNHPLLALTSSTYVFAMTGSNEALRFVSYPTAVLAKSCKLIPTMLMGWALERRNYDLRQWVAALSISFGIAIFNLSRIKEQPAISHKTANDEADANVDEYWKGWVLLSISLAMDGFLGVSQGFLKRKDTRGNNERPPTAVETMLFINAYSLLLLVPMAIADDQMYSGIQLLRDDPALLRAIVLLNAVVAVGQIFIFLTITWYSSLVCTTITTTRKFFTILFSVIHFGHKFSSWQWVSIAMVFAGLYLSIIPNKKGPSEQEKPTQQQKSLKQE